jgi:hypothetical protein
MVRENIDELAKSVTKLLDIAMMTRAVVQSHSKLQCRAPKDPQRVDFRPFACIIADVDPTRRSFVPVLEATLGRSEWSDSEIRRRGFPIQMGETTDAIGCLVKAFGLMWAWYESR